MKIGSKLKSFAGIMLLLVTMVVTVPPRAASAAVGNPSYCDASIARINTNFGTEVPVILVHGMGGRPAEWGSLNDSNSFASKIDVIPGVAVAQMFGYDSSEWVDSPNTGPKLAKTIDCAARLSAQNGGKGKVIVVGYSLGGLLARDALSRRSTDNQRAIADQVDQVVTIGTPHNGANVWAWSVYHPGSPEMARVPHFPQRTIVHTIAGDVTKITYNNQGAEIKRERPYDDTLVSTLSAHAEYTIDTQKGGGQTTIECTKRFRTVLWWTVADGAAPCEHTQLTYNSGNGVRAATVVAITKYATWLNTPTPPASTSLTVGRVTATFDSRWINVDYGASGPGQDGSGWDTTNGTPNPFVDLVNMASWCNEASTITCAVNEPSIIGPAPAVTVGGRTPTSSARYFDSGYTGTSMVWCFDTEQICIHYRRSANTPQLEPSQAFRDLLDGVTWSAQ